MPIVFNEPDYGVDEIPNNEQNLQAIGVHPHNRVEDNRVWLVKKACFILWLIVILQIVCHIMLLSPYCLAIFEWIREIVRKARVENNGVDLDLDDGSLNNLELKECEKRIIEEEEEIMKNKCCQCLNQRVTRASNTLESTSNSVVIERPSENQRGVGLPTNESNLPGSSSTQVQGLVRQNTQDGFFRLNRVEPKNRGQQLPQALNKIEGIKNSDDMPAIIDHKKQKKSPTVKSSLNNIHEKLLSTGDGNSDVALENQHSAKVTKTNQKDILPGAWFNSNHESVGEDHHETSDDESIPTPINEAINNIQTKDKETANISATAQLPDQSAKTTSEYQLATKHAAFAQPGKQSIPTCTESIVAGTNPGSSTTSENHQAVNQMPQTHDENTVLNDHILPNRNNEKTSSDACLTSELIPEINTQVSQCTDTDKISDGEPLASTHDELAFPPKVSTYENTSMHQNKTESNTVDRMQGQYARTETKSLKANESTTSDTECTEKHMPQENPVLSASFGNRNDEVIKEAQYLQEIDDRPKAQTAQAALRPRQVEIALMTCDVNSDRTEKQDFNERKLKLDLDVRLGIANIQGASDEKAKTST